MLSEEYAEKGSQLKDVPYTAAVRITGAADMDDQTFLNTIRGMGEEYGVPRHQIKENGNFVIKISDTRASVLLAVIGVSAAVLFVSVFVIYSIFYISVTGRIRQFGQLRTIGMTSKQIRKTVRYEGAFLSGALSLGIGGVLFVIGTTLVASYNIEEYSRVGAYRFGDYVLQISDNAVQLSEHGAADIQINNPLTKEMEAEIAAFEGVKKVTRYDRFDVQYEYNSFQTDDELMPFESHCIDAMNKAREEGEVFDYDRMVRNKEIAICNNDQVRGIYGWNFKIGDTVRLKWYDGYEYQEDDFKIAGSFDRGKLMKLNNEDADYLNIGNGWFYIPKDLFKTMVPEEYDPGDGIIVEAEDYKTDTAVKDFLQNYADSDSHLKLTCFSDVVNDGRSNYYLVMGLVWGLSAFIIGFALINLINTLVSNAMSRKQEFAMLCSIGMSGSQLKKMIIGEGLILAVKNIVITVFFGTAAGYAMIQTMREFQATYLHWHFPVWYMSGYIAMVMLVPVMISAVITNILEKKTLVERLREAE